MNKSRMNGGWLFALALTLLLAACRDSGTRVRYFHYNQPEGLSTLDPAFAKNQAIMWVVHQIYNTLVETDSSLQLRPSIASRWTISEDRLTYTFHLRPDVRFHDDPCFAEGKGRTLTAQDVVYSFNRLLDPATASPGAWIFNGRVADSQPFTAIDDTTFRLQLKKPFNPMLGILSMQYCSIVPREAVEKYGAEFRRHPVGSGPFRFQVWEEGLALLLQKNPHYFETDEQGKSLPRIDGVKVSFLDSKATEFLEFRQGRLDFINDIDASFKDEVLTKTGRLKPAWEGVIRMETSPYLNIEYLGILVDTSADVMNGHPLLNRRIRQAVNYGFDRRKMMMFLRNSIGIPAESGFVPQGLSSHDPGLVKGYHYDPRKARQLLEDAGYFSQASPKEITLYTIPIYADLASFVARELQDIGLRVRVEAVQKSLLLEMTANRKAPFFRGSWIADYPDPENYLSVFYSANPSPPNYTRFRNRQFDTWYEEALQEKDPGRVIQLYRQMDSLVIAEAPVVPLWYDQVIHMIQPDILHFDPNPLNLLELRHVEFRK